MHRNYLQNPRFKKSYPTSNPYAARYQSRANTTSLQGFLVTQEKYFSFHGFFFVPGSERVVQIHDLTSPTDYGIEAITGN